MADFIRNSETYDSDRRNVITITIEGTSKKVEADQFDKSVGLYKIKKQWILAHI